MNITQSIWPQTDPRNGDPDSIESGFGLHPAIVKLIRVNGGVLEGPDPRRWIDLKIGWKNLKNALASR